MCKLDVLNEKRCKNKLRIQTHLNSHTLFCYNDILCNYSNGTNQVQGFEV